MACMFYGMGGDACGDLLGESVSCYGVSESVHIFYSVDGFAIGVGILVLVV
jgi:hypothetical protein